MRFLADESCDFAIVRALRSAGYDVVTVADAAPGATDDTVIDLALHEKRVLLTEDKDFGQLVYAAAKSMAGVIFIRFPTSARAAAPQLVLDIVNSQKEKLADNFVVIQPSRVRISKPA